jgi:hypothetical protein
MKIKDRGTSAFVGPAELWLEGRHDVELLRELVAAYDRHFADVDKAIVVPIPILGVIQRHIT